jgi:hypothetical protein
MTDCTCHPRANTDGCTEQSCIYHGEENRRKQAEQRADCPEHGRTSIGHYTR